jgi:hypothetical protein
MSDELSAEELAKYADPAHAPAAGATELAPDELAKYADAPQYEYKGGVKQSDINPLTAAVGHFSQGLTSGFADEALGAMGEDKDYIRERNRLTADEYPLLSGASEMVGTGVQMLSPAGRLIGSKMPGAAGGRLARVGAGTLEAGVFGGASGAGNSDKADVSDRLVDAGKAALASMPFGAGGAAAGEVIGALGQKARSKLASILKEDRKSIGAQIGKQRQEALGGVENMDWAVKRALEMAQKGQMSNHELLGVLQKAGGVSTREEGQLVGMRANNAEKKMRDLLDNPINMGQELPKRLDARHGAAKHGAMRLLPQAVSAALVGGAGYYFGGGLGGAAIGAGLGAAGARAGLSGGVASQIMSSPKVLRKLTGLKKWGPVIGQYAAKGGTALSSALYTIANMDPEAGVQIDSIIQGDDIDGSEIAPLKIED